MAGRALILEPALVDARGHHAFAAARFAALIGPQRSMIAAGASWNGPQSYDGCPVRPLFRYHRQDVARLRRYGPFVARALSIADRTAKPLVTSMRQRRNRIGSQANISIARADAAFMTSVMMPDFKSCLKALRADTHDRVFIPSADAEVMLAIAELLSANNQIPPIYLRLMYDDVGCHQTDPTWRSALKVLMGAPRGSELIHLLVETRAFAREVRRVWGSDTTILPHPSDLTPTAAPPPEEGFTLYVAGHARTDKGLHLIPEVVQALTTRLASTNTRVRLRVHGGTIAGAELVDVECLSSHSPEADYARLWQQAHVALLLHDPEVYALRGSGVACDAVASARPFVCLNGSSLAEWVTHGNGRVAEPTPRGIADAVCQIVQDYERYANASTRAAAQFPGKLRAGLAGLINDLTSTKSMIHSVGSLL